jgi:hypothetical protein
MEEKDLDLWWDVIQDIIQKDLEKVYRNYERNERLYKQMISQVENVMPPFEYEPLVLFIEPETSNEEKKQRGYRWGRTIRYKNSKGGLDSLEREVVKQILE